MRSQIGQWGNSLAIRLPKHIVQELDLKANDAIEVSVLGGKVVLKPIQALPELTLEELLDHVTESPEPEVDWGEAVGGEVW